MSEPQYTFYVQSMVTSRTGQPAVTVTVNGADFTVNLSVAEARDLAANLLQAAEAAVGDAFLVNFLRKDIEAEEPLIVLALVRFREYREAGDL